MVLLFMIFEIFVVHTSTQRKKKKVALDSRCLETLQNAYGNFDQIAILLLTKGKLWVWRLSTIWRVHYLYKDDLILQWIAEDMHIVQKSRSLYDYLCWLRIPKLPELTATVHLLLQSSPRLMTPRGVIFSNEKT